MCARDKIENVNVIADARAVRRFVIGAVNLDVRFLAERDFQDIRNEMRLEAVIFAKFCRGAGSVEITQRDETQPVNLVVPAQDFFEDQFRFAVWIDRPLRRGLVDRHALGRAESRAGGRKDEVLHAGFDHGVEQVHAVRQCCCENILRDSASTRPRARWRRNA